MVSVAAKRLPAAFTDVATSRCLPNHALRIGHGLGGQRRRANTQRRMLGGTNWAARYMLAVWLDMKHMYIYTYTTTLWVINEVGGEGRRETRSWLFV